MDLDSGSDSLSIAGASPGASAVDTRPSSSPPNDCTPSYLDISGEKNHCMFLTLAAAFQVPIVQLMAMEREALERCPDDVFIEKFGKTKAAHLSDSGTQEWTMGSVPELELFAEYFGGRVAFHLIWCASAGPSVVTGDDDISQGYHIVQRECRWQQAEVHICIHVCSIIGTITDNAQNLNHYNLVELEPSNNLPADRRPLQSWWSRDQFMAFYYPKVPTWINQINSMRQRRGELNRQILEPRRPAPFPHCVPHDRDQRPRVPLPAWVAEDFARVHRSRGTPSFHRILPPVHIPIRPPPAASVPRISATGAPFTASSGPSSTTGASTATTNLRMATSPVTLPGRSLPPLHPLPPSNIIPSRSMSSAASMAAVASLLTSKGSAGGKKTVRQFTSEEVKQLEAAVLQGVTTNMREHGDAVRELSARFSARYPIEPRQIQTWIQRHVRSHSKQSAPHLNASPTPNIPRSAVNPNLHTTAPPVGLASDSVQSDSITTRRHTYRRRMNVAECSYLGLLLAAGFDISDNAHLALIVRIADLFSHRVTCLTDSIIRWIKNPPGNVLQVVHSDRELERAKLALSQNELPPYLSSVLPQHTGVVRVLNHERKDTNTATHTSVEELSSTFWESSGLDLHRPVRDRLSSGSQLTETAVPEEELEQLLHQSLGIPVSDVVRSDNLSAYNEYMDPHTPMVACASCGTVQMHDVAVPLEPVVRCGYNGIGAGGLPVKGLQPVQPLSINQSLFNTPIQLTSDQVIGYKSMDPRWRPAVSVTRVQDHLAVVAERRDKDRARLEMEQQSESRPGAVNEILTKMADEDYEYSYYHLDDQLVHTQPDGDKIVRLCTTCHAKISKKGNTEPPMYSIAAGCDWGRPQKLNLPVLSMIEQHMIAAYRVFGTVVKLVAPFGMSSNTRQSAFTGHTIVFPHEGPLKLINEFPNLNNLRDSISIMFVGSRSQWSASRHTILSKFRGIFEVRPWAMMQWLTALHAVGHPLYQSMTVPAGTHPIWQEAVAIADRCLDDVIIADDPVTRRIEQQSSSDVAGVRQSNQVSGDDDLRSPASAIPAGSSTGAINLSTASGTIPTDSVAIGVVTESESIALNSVLLSHPRHTSALESSQTGTDRISAGLQVLQAVANATGVGSDDTTSIPRPNPSMNIAMQSLPANDLKENDLIMIGAFPHLFFLGRKLPCAGTVPPLLRQRLMRFHDQRFQTNHELLFLLFNQLQRHAVLRRVSARVKSSPESIQAFYDTVEEANFQASLQTALRDPSGPVAERLLRKLLPIVQVCGQSVPYSAAQRQQTLPRLIAYARQFGLPSLFLTISPSDLDQPLTVRLSVPSTTPGSDASQRLLDFALPGLSERGRLLALNPVAAAEVFQRIMETMLKCFVGFLPLKRSSSIGGAPPLSVPPVSARRQTIFGRAIAFIFVPESQGRGTLHSHGIMWTDLAPALMSELAEYPEMVKILATHLDAICTATLPTSVHEEHKIRREKGIPANRPSLQLSMSPARSQDLETNSSSPCICSYSSAMLDQASSFEQRWQYTAAIMQCHNKHTLTCRKGKAGKYGCRMAMPQTHRPEPTGPVELTHRLHETTDKLIVMAADSVSPRQVSHTDASSPPGNYSALPPRDHRIIVWELHRPNPKDDTVVAFNPTLTAAASCNTALYPLGCAQSARAILFYLMKYITKDVTPLANTLSAIHEARRHVVNHPSTAENSGEPIRTAQHLFTRVLNTTIAGKTEVSAEMASAALIGMPSTFESHPVQFCFIWPALNAIRSSRHHPADVSESDVDFDLTTDSARTELAPDEEHDEEFRHEASILRGEPEMQSDGSHLHLPFDVEQDIERSMDAQIPDEVVPIYKAVIRARRSRAAKDQHTPSHNAEEPVAKAIRDSDSDNMDIDEEDDDNSRAAPSSSTSETLASSSRIATVLPHPADLRKQFVAVPQFMHYHLRGPDLRSLCLWEWIGTIQIDPMTDYDIKRAKQSADEGHEEVSDDADVDEAEDTDPGDNQSNVEPATEESAQAGNTASKPRKLRRARLLNFRFHPSHPLYATHIQRARAVQAVPALAGRPPPPHPGLRSSTGQTPANQARQARSYAEYMLILFVPWADGDPTKVNGPDLSTYDHHDLNYDAFHSVFDTYHRSPDRSLYCRAECILNITYGMLASNRTKAVVQQWRHRSVLPWGSQRSAVVSGMDAETALGAIDPNDRGARADPDDDAELQAAQDQIALINSLREVLNVDFVDLNNLRKEQQLAGLHGRYEKVIDDLFEDSHRQPDADHISMTDDDLLPAPARIAMEVDHGLGDIPPTAVIHLHARGDISRVTSHLEAPIQSTSSSNTSEEEVSAMDVDQSPDEDPSPSVRENLDHAADSGADWEDPLPATHESQLNHRQKQALEICLDWITRDRNYRANVDLASSGAPAPLRLLVHGGAGTGKSTFACGLIRASMYVPDDGDEHTSPTSAVVCAAPTGVAASLLIRGRTLHSLFGIPINQEKLKSMSITTKTSAKLELRHRRILLIDEVSMVGAWLLGAIDQRLREILENPQPFGGMGVVLMGDFYQLPAVRDMSLPSAALACDAVDVKVTPSVNAMLAGFVMRGGQLMREFKFCGLTQQMRVDSEDTEHTALISMFQCHLDRRRLKEALHSVRGPLTHEFVRALHRKRLTPQQVREDPTWRDAVIVVPTNAQRHYMLFNRARQFATHHGRPILRWKYPLPISDTAGGTYPSVEDKERLYQKIPQLVGFFVQDAPVFLRENINPAKGLANGSSGRLHSISWDEEWRVLQYSNQIRNAAPGEVIDVDPPLSVNVSIRLSKTTSEQWQPRKEETLFPTLLHTDAASNTHVIVPVTCSYEEKVRIGSRDNQSTMKVLTYAYELAFVVTFHKCQGRTMKKVILDLNNLKLPQFTKVTYASLYVGLTRVRRGCDVAIMPPVTEGAFIAREESSEQSGTSNSVHSRTRVHYGETDLTYLMNLRPNSDLLTWLAGFESDFSWNSLQARSITLPDRR